MKLFLSGGGSEAFKLDEEFIKEIDKSKPMLYIPIAMDPKKHSCSECFKWIKDYFRPFSFGNIIMKTDLNKINRDEINKFGSVYIGGGNTPILLKELRESGFIEILKDLMNKDIPIAGGSAGAIIFTKTIIPSLSADKNKVKLKNLNGLNKINDYEMWCHYESSMDKEILEYMKKYNFNKIIALPDKVGIYVNNNNMIILENKTAYVFNEKEKREIKDGEILK